jgi:hypothetical protein
MTEYLTLGSTPANEDCAQVGRDDYYERARKECRAYINQLNRLFPQAVDKGVSFRIKSNQHDFGTYYEVNACFNDDDQAAGELAYHIESHLPGEWDDAARLELTLEAIRPKPDYFLVISYDDDQQQWFHDVVEAKTANDAERVIADKREGHILSAAAYTVSQLEGFCASLKNAAVR